MKHATRTLLRIAFIGILVFCCKQVWATTGGGISGTVTDENGGVIPGASVTVRNLDTAVAQTTTTNGEGFYAFTNLPVGRYELEIIRDRFKPYKRTGLVIDVNTQLRVDQVLTIGEQSQEVVVSGTAAQVETESTQVGQVVTSTEITGVALNGRSFTDLLALQPGIVPMSTQQPNSIVMAGATVAIAPSGDLNPGNQSISGQREDANGYMVNGGDVKELMNGGTTIVPDLDSIAEFRILTNNFDAEYGDYSGGIVNVVTKSGTNEIHGSGFEFLRNTVLDARNYFSPTRAFFRQNQFGGTVGGPIKSGKVFFFADYQGTRMAQAIDTGLISVPSLAYRSGDFITGPNGTGTSPLIGAVGGANLAGILTGELGYPVSANEPYFTPGCTSSTCVFPGAMIPRAAWSAPAKSLLNFIPPPNDGPATFTTASQGKVLRDDKASFRIDGNSRRWGLLSAYYFFDDFTLNNPYPTGQGGASVPGFNALNTGRSQLVNLADTKTFSGANVNEFHFSFMRSANAVGQPVGGIGPSLESQGFTTCPGSTRTPGCAGIFALAPSIEGIENTIFNSFVVGVPITNLAQANNTFTVSDNFSTVRGSHTIKAGFELSVE